MDPRYEDKAQSYLIYSINASQPRSILTLKYMAILIL